MTLLAAPAPPRVAGPQRARLLSRSWALTVLLVGFPVLWALGLAAFAVQVMAVPMALDLLLRRRTIRVPRGFGLWLLFLLVSLAGFFVLGINPPQTLPDGVTGRLVGYATRESSYLAITVLFLWAGNMSERDLPERKVIRQLAFFFVTVAAGGVLGLLLPTFSFTSPLAALLPHEIVRTSYVSHLVHPAFAQVQEFGGDRLPRPSAPFAYTNTWGSQISLLATWFVVGWLVMGSKLQRLLVPLGLVVAVVTVVLSLNRGVWLGVAVTVAYVAVVLALRRNVGAVIGLLLALTVGGVALLQTPVGDVVHTRVENGKSNDIRAFTSERALELANRSPVVGYGSTRATVGSQSSIAIGKSAGCPACGNVAIGINGSFFTLVVTTGYLGMLLFFGFWLSQAWRSRHDRSIVGLACQLTLLLAVLYSFFYTIELIVPFLALALMWRRRLASAGGDDDAQDRGLPRGGAAGDRLRQPARQLGTAAG